MMKFFSEFSIIMGICLSLILPATTVIAQTWEPANGPYGSMVNALAVNSSGDIFAGTSDSGVFRSTDNGDTWTKINNGLTNTNILSLAINSSGHIFAGTFGGGAFRSTDQGNSWSAISNGLSNNFVYALTVNASDNILAGTWAGGVSLSTDNGDSWTQINNGLLHPHVYALAINSSGDIFAGTRFGGVYRSTDDGNNWVQIKNGLAHTCVYTLAADVTGNIFAGTADGISRLENNCNDWVQTGVSNGRIFALTTNSSNDVFAGIESNGVFRSADNGVSWIEINNGLTDTEIKALFADSSDDIFAGTESSGVFKTMRYLDAATIINRDTISYIYAFAVTPLEIKAYLGEFEGDYTANDVDPMTLAINSAVSPLSSTVLPSHPDFNNAVLEIVFHARDFVMSYDLLWNTSVQSFSVTGNYFDDTPFVAVGQFIFVGHRSGDVNANGLVDIFDVSYLVAYLYLSGPAPRILESADVNNDGAINVFDITYLIAYLYLDGPKPM